MSIIYDALKKLDKDSPAFSKQGKKLPAQRRGGSKKVIIFFGALAVFISAFFLSYNYFDFQGIKSRPRAGATVQEAAMIEPIPFVEPKEKEVIKDEPVPAETVEMAAIEKEEQGLEESSYKLEGIIFTESRPLAVINGQRFSEQDSVGGLLVTRINRSSVKLVNPETKEEKVLLIEF